MAYIGVKIAQNSIHVVCTRPQSHHIVWAHQRAELKSTLSPQCLLPNGGYTYLENSIPFLFYYHRDQNATLPNKFDMNSTTLSKSTANPYLKKSVTSSWKNPGPNHDPGVNSDDEDEDELEDNSHMEEDDMFRYI